MPAIAATRKATPIARSTRRVAGSSVLTACARELTVCPPRRTATHRATTSSASSAMPAMKPSVTGPSRRGGRAAGVRGVAQVQGIGGDVVQLLGREREPGHRAGPGDHRLADGCRTGLRERRGHEAAADRTAATRGPVTRRAVRHVQLPAVVDVGTAHDHVRDRRPVAQGCDVPDERLGIRLVEPLRPAQLGGVGVGEGHPAGAQDEVGERGARLADVRAAGAALSLRPVTGRAGGEEQLLAAAGNGDAGRARRLLGAGHGPEPTDRGDRRADDRDQGDVARDESPDGWAARVAARFAVRASIAGSRRAGPCFGPQGAGLPRWRSGRIRDACCHSLDRSAIACPAGSAGILLWRSAHPALQSHVVKVTSRGDRCQARMSTGHSRSRWR